MKTKDNKTVTLKQLNQALKPILGRFGGIDNKFEAIDKRFEAVDRRFEAIEYRLEVLEKAVHNFEETFKENFTRMYNHIDAFMKRTESNGHEILFLGRQHDDSGSVHT